MVILLFFFQCVVLYFMYALVIGRETDVTVSTLAEAQLHFFLITAA